MILNEFFNLPQVFEKETDEGIFGSKKPAEPFEFYLDGCDPYAVKKYLLNKFGSKGWRVAGPGAGTSRVFVAMSPELYPTANEAKWDIESNCGQQGVAEDVRTESAELAKQYGWAYNQGEYGASMTHPKHGRISLSSPVTSRSGDTAVEREWTHNNASGIGDRSLAQHLQSLKEQGVSEAKDDYVPPKEADYGPEYQAMVRRVGEKARAQEKAKQQQQPPKAPVRESRLALLRQIIQS